MGRPVVAAGSVLDLGPVEGLAQQLDRGRSRKRLRLRGFVIYSWRDGAPYAPNYQDQWGLHTGLVDLNGRPKPALLGFIDALKGLR